MEGGDVKQIFYKHILPSQFWCHIFSRNLPRLEHFTQWRQFTNYRLSYSRQIILYILKKEVFIFTIKFIFHKKFKNTHFYQEWINFGKIKDRLRDVNWLYRSTSQSQDDLEKFINNLEPNLDSIVASNTLKSFHFLVDFNANRNLSYKNDIKHNSIRTTLMV